MMDRLYLGYTLGEYLFMSVYMIAMVLFVYFIVRISDLKQQLEYYRHLERLKELHRISKK